MKGSLTANAPRSVSSRHTCPCSPRATGPVSVAASPRSKAAAIAGPCGGGQHDCDPRLSPVDEAMLAAAARAAGLTDLRAVAQLGGSTPHRGVAGGHRGIGVRAGDVVRREDRTATATATPSRGSPPPWGALAGSGAAPTLVGAGTDPDLVVMTGRRRAPQRRRPAPRPRPGRGRDGRGALGRHAGHAAPGRDGRRPRRLRPSAGEPVAGTPPPTGCPRPWPTRRTGWSRWGRPSTCRPRRSSSRPSPTCRRG